MNNEMDFFVDKSLNLLDVENSTSRTNQDDQEESHLGSSDEEHNDDHDLLTQLNSLSSCFIFMRSYNQPSSTSEQEDHSTVSL